MHAADDRAQSSSQQCAGRLLPLSATGARLHVWEEGRCSLRAVHRLVLSLCLSSLGKVTVGGRQGSPCRSVLLSDSLQRKTPVRACGRSQCTDFCLWQCCQAVLTAQGRGAKEEQAGVFHVKHRSAAPRETKPVPACQCPDTVLRLSRVILSLWRSSPDSMRSCAHC